MSQHATIQDLDLMHRQLLADEIEKWRKDPDYIPIIDDMELSVRLRTPFFDFGTALRRMKEGKRITRLGWNGNRQPERIHYSDGGVELDCEGAEKFVAKMYLFLAHVSPNEVEGNGPGPDMVNGDCTFIAMKDAQGKIVVGWLASQTDMLSEDWVEVP